MNKPPYDNYMPIEIALAQGWRILAGNFYPHNPEHMHILQAILSHITATSGRAATVQIHHPLTDTHLQIWRPSAEMETISQTQHRINQLKLNQ